MSNYEPCFRVSLLKHHLKRLGIVCNDERLIKILSLSFETMIRSIIADCAHVQKQNGSPMTLTSDLLVKTLLNSNTSDINSSSTTLSQQQNSSTFDSHNIFDM